MSAEAKQTIDDGRTINPNDDQELRYWSQNLNVSIAALRDLVKDVGNSVFAIRARIGPQKVAATGSTFTIK